MIFKAKNKCEIFRAPLDSNLAYIANQIEENSNSSFLWYVVPKILNTNVTNNEYIATVVYQKKLKLGAFLLIVALIAYLFGILIAFGHAF